MPDLLLSADGVLKRKELFLSGVVEQLLDEHGQLDDWPAEVAHQPVEQLSALVLQEAVELVGLPAPVLDFLPAETALLHALEAIVGPEV